MQFRLHLQLQLYKRSMLIWKDINTSHRGLIRRDWGKKYVRLLRFVRNSNIKLQLISKITNFNRLAIKAIFRSLVNNYLNRNIIIV